MDTTKKARTMTAKGFLHKAEGKISADAFLKQHRAWLETGELAQFTSPILAKLDAQEIMPTPALETIRAVVLGHHLAVESAKFDEKFANPGKAKGKPREEKQYHGTIYAENGSVATRTTEDGEEKDLVFSSDNAGEVHGWVDRRLFDGAPTWHGVIVNTKMIDKNTGDNFTTNVLRDDAIARILKRPTSAAMRKTAKTSSKLSWGMKVTNDRSRFSGG